MKYLKDILNGISISKIIGPENVFLKGLCQELSQAKPEMLFAAIPGMNVDGYNFIDQAIKKGVRVILCQKKPIIISDNITYIIVKDVCKTLGFISANFYDHPSKKLKIIGVTGTNGKTTISILLYDLFSKLGSRVALISTIYIKIIDKVFSNNYTTPNVIIINKYLKKAVEKKCEYAFIEISSHGIKQKRISGIFFLGGIFTNITHEHLDYHKKFKDYILTKCNFFKSLSKKSFSLINIDDNNFSFFWKNIKNSKKISYSINKSSNYKARVLEQSFEGTKILINNYEFWTPLIGIFNVYNLLAVYSTSLILGNNYLETLIMMSKLNPLIGRFQQILSKKEGIRIIIDYAHNPNSLQNVLNTIYEIKKEKEQIICLIGCGGNRDKAKRPIMTQIACDKAYKIIITSDNPRNEDPDKIIDDMEIGLSDYDKKKILRITNRNEAIKNIILSAKKNDIILISGKGHENYQEIKGIKTKFNDMETVKKYLLMFNK